LLVVALFVGEIGRGWRCAAWWNGGGDGERDGVRIIYCGSFVCMQLDDLSDQMHESLCSVPVVTQDGGNDGN
jgi:hypothetical protein